MKNQRSNKKAGWQKVTELSLTGTQLKIIALGTMVMDHIGVMFLPAESVTCWIFRGIGRISFPLYCFLLIEGFCHTGNLKQYMKRMGLFALVSEIPFDLAVQLPGETWMKFCRGEVAGAVLWEYMIQKQNVFFTLFLGLLALQGFVWLQNKGWREWSVLWCVAIAALAWFLRTDYDWGGILLICILYLFRNQNQKRNILAYAWMVLCIDPSEITALPAFLLMDHYNGKKGKNPYPQGFYLSYPVHLFILWICMLVIS